MKTPICDFIRSYRESGSLRLHMPGHKGKEVIGPEIMDITEIDGADVLYSAKGIIKESEENAAALFGTAKTLYSAEGSSLCIRAMVYLAKLYGRVQGRKPLILAARNVHKTFMTAAAVMDVEISWLYPQGGSLLSCPVNLGELEKRLKSENPTAVYITSPDYIGNIADIENIAGICHKYGCILMCDNAHGAYLKFLPEAMHPMELGADICCDSAHKTFPALTGAAYLHISHSAPKFFAENAENALSLFASTSPSYIILQSLDAVNRIIADELPMELKRAAERVDVLKLRLKNQGFRLFGTEPMKLTIMPKSCGYTGLELADALSQKGIVSEFADPDFVVMMFSYKTTDEEICILENALLWLDKRAAILDKPPVLVPGEAVISPHEAVMLPSRIVPVCEAEGKILAGASVTCPPAVPIAVCGERINESCRRCMEYYGIDECRVVTEEINGDER